MTLKNKRFIRISAFLLLLCLMLGACNQTGGKNPTQGSTEQKTFCLEVKSEGGSPLADITVYIYADDTLNDLVAFAKTDKDGKASFAYNDGSYVAVLVGVPAGYVVDACYPVTGDNTVITLPVELQEGDLETVTYNLGDIMQDFIFTAADGTQYQLSRLLQEKKAVVLNFWFLSCNPCKAEFPSLQEAYAEYADDVMVLAIDPVDQDNTAITAYGQELGLTFPMGAGDSQWEKAMKIQGYPTTVVIDKFGTIALMHSGSITDAKIFKDMFAFFTAEDYTQTVVEDLEQIITVEEVEGTASTPTEISGQSRFQLTIPAGQTHHVNIHKMTNVWMQVKNSNIYVEYNGKKYTPSKGVLGLMVSAPSTFDPARVIFGNSSDKEQTFTVTLSSLPGSYSNPYTLQVGEFSTNVSAGNDQGVYFTYTAPEDGHFKLQCLNISPDVGYDFSIMNLTTSAVRNMSTDGLADGETGKTAVTISMNAGEKLRITISTLPDDTNSYPAATFRMLASFTAGDVEDIEIKEKIAYAVTVTDENRNPIVGANISLKGTEDNSASLITDENGVISAYLVEDTYTGTLVIPEGYKATTASFVLTPEMPMLSLKLDTYVIEYADYTVRVLDEDGNGVAGVLITIGSTYGATDENGVFTVNLVKEDYTVSISAPEGYTAEQNTYTLTDGNTLLGIRLQKAQNEEQTGIDYSVTVVDGSGVAMTDVLVTFMQDGNTVTMVQVDANGTATAKLPAGNYTVSLHSASGAALGFEENQGILSAEKTTATIVVATNVGGNGFKAAWWGNYYEIKTGSFKMNFTSKTNYCADYDCWMYVFAPQKSGTYRYSISGASVMGYYGSVSYPFGPSASTEETGYIESVIRDSEFVNDNQPHIVLGIKPAAGATSAVVTVTRVSDAPVELAVETYTPISVLTPFKMTENGKLTYVDIEGQAQIEKGEDGYYYLDGKKLYMNLSNHAPYITFSDMLGLSFNGTEWVEGSTGTGMKGIRYENGQPVCLEDFTQCMRDYITVSDPVSGLYPLTDDLCYMVKQCGDYMGWWDIEHPNYLFAAKANLNAEIAWMFAVCYVD